jgi:4-amino-4-deoxy-L-arabinose transferase-like glycosyltransferase
MTRRTFLAGAALVLVLAGALRVVWLTSDPPTSPTVGVVWHDEGPWVHNARNRALWGVWRTDNWNPVYLAPVFTGLEYAVFSIAGVGTWQARTVPAISGLAAIVFLMAGLEALAGRRAALLGGGLLAVNYAFVMWNRAALMESTMTSLMVVSWAAYARSDDSRTRGHLWAGTAGVAAVLAFFSKASAAFFVAALIVELAWRVIAQTRLTRAVVWTAAGLVLSSTIILVLFALPHWHEVQFYNWQMSVARKPEYTLRALVERASWLPLVHDFFTWMWPILVIAATAIVRIVTSWRDAKPAERLLVLWVLIGLLELVVHDSGNVRRYVMFIPALIALSAELLVGPAPGTRTGPGPSWPARWLAVPLVLALGYLVAASGFRLAALEDVRSGVMHATVLRAIVTAGACAIAVWLAWPAIVGWLGKRRLPVLVAAAAAAVTMAGDLGHFAAWARARQTVDYEASVALGRLLPPGTLVQGKLANGLALENRIRPIFIGHNFGNYDDRLHRGDVRYILTYVSPSVGFESQAESGMIQELLDRYPQRRIVATFNVNETGGPDRAALIDKVPGTDPRARD